LVKNVVIKLHIGDMDR